MNKRAILYARVSTEEQTKGSSLQTQLQAMRKYATEHAFVVVKELKEEYSGAKLERPELDYARMMIRRKEADAVIVFTSDRLSRNLAHLLILREEWRKSDIELHFVNRGKSEDSTESRLLENIEGVIAEYEREKIRERSSRGLKAKAQQRWVGIGVPFGYSKVGAKRDARLIIFEDEATVIRRIFRLYTGKDGERLPMRRIAERLQVEGVPAPYKRRNQTGKGWYVETVKRIIDRRAYIGEFIYGDHSIVIPELQIIDWELWEAAQRQRQNNRARSRRRQYYHYLLTSHVFCICGNRMFGHTQKRSYGIYVYYCCPNQQVQRHISPCRELSIRTDVADPIVWNWLEGLIGDEKQLEHGIRRIRDREAIEIAPKRDRLTTIDELITKAENKIRRVISTIATVDDEFTADVLRVELNATQNERKGLDNERKRLAIELEQDELTQQDEQKLRTLASQIKEEIDNASFEQKRYILDKLDVKVQLRRDGEQRFLDCTCALQVGIETIELESHQYPPTDRRRGYCTKPTHAAP